MQYAPANQPLFPGAGATGNGNILETLFGSVTQFMGISSLFGMLSTGGYGNQGVGNSMGFDGMKLLILGTIVELGRRFMQWVMQRWQFKYTTTVRVDQGDPAYEWILLFLTQEKVWQRSKDFHVSAASSLRKWGITTSTDGTLKGSAQYVPSYNMPQLFSWNGYWIEVKRNDLFNPAAGQPGPGGGMAGGASSIYLTLYTLKLSAMYELVEEARKRYIEVSRPNVAIFSADANSASYGPGFMWTTVKHKARRPLDSIILPEGLLASIIEDAKDFFASEDWYLEAGIPHRRGYLLHGPPGTGKSSTIYTLAGELGVEIYSISLASQFIDDAFLQRAIDSVPKHSIILIEDIDCAFPSREEAEQEEENMMNGFSGGFPGRTPFGGPPVMFQQASPRSSVTMSGLLNLLDGVGSEEGRLFFCTTNYVDRLDAAMLRPGRIDRKIQYTLAVKEQASALFTRFFPAIRFPDVKSPIDPSLSALEVLATMSQEFASHVPEQEFSTAELQGFLLSCKRSPRDAVSGIATWVEEERTQKKEKKEREEKRKAKIAEAKKRYPGLGTGVGFGGSAWGTGGPGIIPPSPGTVVPTSSTSDIATLVLAAEEKENGESAGSGDSMESSLQGSPTSSTSGFIKVKGPPLEIAES